ncbi:MAG: MBOAT family protein [Flavobacteriales bacterium]
MIQEILNNIEITRYFVYDSSRPLLFNSKVFFVWFLIIYLIYNFIKDKKRIRVILLLSFSLFFYYLCSGLFFTLLIISTLINYALGYAIYQAPSNIWKKVGLWEAVIFNLGLLGYYKYTNFLIRSINDIQTTFQFGTFHIEETSIFLPVGISFFTFQAMSYTIDIYRGKIKPERNILNFGFFISFFPQLVAGPIVRAKEFIPQIHKKLSLTKEELSRALFLIMGGLFKKVVISDFISVNFVDRVFNNPALYGSFEAWTAFYGYALQIYCDFSGYSDMAIGLALLFGFKLPTNFDLPYQSKSITEFWRRWHMSLSAWLKDYLYISLGGNRKGKIFTYRNLMLTMLLGGLWHGASWKFIMWGGMHGVLLSIERMAKPLIEKIPQKVRYLPGWLITFHFVCFAWIFFRADSFGTAVTFMQQMFQAIDPAVVMRILNGYTEVFILIGAGFLLHFLPKVVNESALNIFTKAPVPVKALSLSLVIWLVIQASSSQVIPFIYYQF